MFADSLSPGTFWPERLCHVGPGGKAPFGSLNVTWTGSEMSAGETTALGTVLYGTPRFAKGLKKLNR